MDMKLSGYKTYIAALALLAYAIGGWISGKVDPNQAYLSIVAALGMLGIGHKLDRQTEEVEE